jgi:hypothetical protein
VTLGTARAGDVRNGQLQGDVRNSQGEIRLG